MSFSLFWKMGSSLLILFDYQWVYVLRNTGTKGAYGKKVLLDFQSWSGWINLTVTAKVKASRVGRAIQRDFYFILFKDSLCQTYIHRHKHFNIYIYILHREGNT